MEIGILFLRVGDASTLGWTWMLLERQGGSQYHRVSSGTFCVCSTGYLLMNWEHEGGSDKPVLCEDTQIFMGTLKHKVCHGII